MWLKRAWQSGLRLVVAQTVEDDQLCRVMKRRSHSCSEPATIAKEVRELRGLQRYVDARSGGRGRGFFRLVHGPAAARRVIERGKLAVVIGVESSNPFGCRLRQGRTTCTRADVDRGLAAYHRLGIRSLFLAHWFDNAFAGSALEGDLKGAFIGAMNRLETGHYFRVAACPHPGQGEVPSVAPKAAIDLVAPFFDGVAALSTLPVPAYPATRRCNARGLTALGAHLVRRMMKLHMLIEADHLGERARDQVLAIAAAHHYPVVSGHNGTGGAWSASELRRLYALGGIAAATPETAPALVRKLLRLPPLRGLARRPRRAARQRRRRVRRPPRPAAGEPAAALPVHLAPRPRHLPSPADRHAGLRPQSRRRRPLRPGRGPHRRRGAPAAGREGPRPPVPLGRGVPADVGAGAAALVGRRGRSAVPDGA